MALTDGYLAPEVAEAALAHRVYDLIKGRRSPRSIERFPDVAQVWVLGAPGWLSQAAEPLRSIGEGDTRPDYRMLAWRVSDDATRTPYAFDRNAAAYAGGLRPQKTHANRVLFQEHARLMLSLLSDYLLDAQADPLQLFHDLQVPVVVVGDPSSRDGRCSSRIQ